MRFGDAYTFMQVMMSFCLGIPSIPVWCERVCIRPASICFFWRGRHLRSPDIEHSQQQLGLLDQSGHLGARRHRINSLCPDTRLLVVVAGSGGTDPMGSRLCIHDARIYSPRSRCCTTLKTLKPARDCRLPLTSGRRLIATDCVSSCVPMSAFGTKRTLRPWRHMNRRGETSG